MPIHHCLEKYRHAAAAYIYAINVGLLFAHAMLSLKI